MSRPMTRLSLCLMLSLALHLSIFVSGHPFSGQSRNTGATVSVKLAAVLVSLESGSEIGQLEGRGEMIVRDVAPSVTSQKKVSSTVIRTVAGGEGNQWDTKKPTGLFDFDSYHVRSELSQAPYVINDVLITAPPTKGDFAWRLQIRLFISESGFVDRLVVEESTAPVYVEEDAIKQFRTARYAPGVIDGRQVKSQLLVEVTEP